MINALLVSLRVTISWKFLKSSLSNNCHSFFAYGSSWDTDNSLYREFKSTTKVFLLIIFSGELFCMIWIARLKTVLQNCLAKGDYDESRFWCFAVERIWDKSKAVRCYSASFLSKSLKQRLINLSLESRFIMLKEWIIIVQSYKCRFSLKSWENYWLIAVQNSAEPFLEWLYRFVIRAKFFPSIDSSIISMKASYLFQILSYFIPFYCSRKEKKLRIWFISIMLSLSFEKL
jgi:hypothetical protein